MGQVDPEIIVAAIKRFTDFQTVQAGADEDELQRRIDRGETVREILLEQLANVDLAEMALALRRYAASVDLTDDGYSEFLMQVDDLVGDIYPPDVAAVVGLLVGLQAAQLANP